MPQITEEGFTSPNCKSCDEHDSLNEKVDSMEEKNTKEHSEILKGLENAAINIKWMNIIGRWILVSMLGYFIALGYFIFMNEWVEKEDIRTMDRIIQQGEVLHYFNERNIADLKTDIEILKIKHKDDK